MLAHKYLKDGYATVLNINSKKKLDLPAAKSEQ